MRIWISWILVTHVDHMCESHHMEILAIGDRVARLGFQVRKKEYHIKVPWWMAHGPGTHFSTIQPSITKEAARNMDLANAKLEASLKKQLDAKRSRGLENGEEEKIEDKQDDDEDEYATSMEPQDGDNAKGIEAADKNMDDNAPDEISTT